MEATEDLRRVQKEQEKEARTAKEKEREKGKVKTLFLVENDLPSVDEVAEKVMRRLRATPSTKGSTTSGSTSQHGPRFKRYRLPVNGIKEVPDEVHAIEEPKVHDPTAVHDLRVNPGSILEEVNAATAASGWAVMDSGATRTVCGEGPWNEVLEFLAVRGKNEEVKVTKEARD